jgi:hypothetical protein
MILLQAIIKTELQSFCGRLGYDTVQPGQNYMHEETKSRLQSGNACYHSVQKLLPSQLLSYNIKNKIYRTIILPVVLYGCHTFSH